MREGDNIQQLVKNFMVSYGLKKELMSTIIESMEQLVQKNEKKKQNSKAEVSMEEHELKIEQSPIRDSINNIFSKPEKSMENSTMIGPLLFRLNFELGTLCCSLFR